MSTHPTAPGDGADEQVAPTRPLEPVTDAAPDAGGTRQLDDLLDESAHPARADAAGPAPEPSSPSWAPSPAPRKPVRKQRPVRVGTVVWGLVVAACGVVALAVAGGASVDGQMLVIGLLGGAGVALVLGSVVAGVRRRTTR